MIVFAQDKGKETVGSDQGNFLMSEAIAVGDFTFVDKVKSELGFKTVHRRLTEVTGTYTLREESEPYSANFTHESEGLRLENTILWEKNVEIT